MTPSTGRYVDNTDIRMNHELYWFLMLKIVFGLVILVVFDLQVPEEEEENEEHLAHAEYSKNKTEA